MLLRGRVWTTLASLRSLQQPGSCRSVLSYSDGLLNAAGPRGDSAAVGDQKRHIAQPAYASDDESTSDTDIELGPRPITPDTRCGILSDHMCFSFRQNPL